MAEFEGKERRLPKIEACLKENGFASLEEAREICLAKGVDVESLVKGVQPIAFENAVWAYTLGAAIGIKRGVTSAADAAKCIGEALQSFCIPGSVAEQRKVGLGHGNLGAMLLSEETKCFAFLAGHESFAAAEGAIGIARNANKARKTPIRVILNGLGKDAAYIISRINGFTYVETDFDSAKANAATSAATAQTTPAKALQSCRAKALISPSPVTPPTPPVSSTLLQVLTKNGQLKTAENISPLLPAAAPAEPFIPIT